MTRRTKAAVWITAAVLVIAAGTAYGIRRRNHRVVVIHLEGVVLEQSADPRKQVPVPNANVTAILGGISAQSTSGADGGFRLDLRTSADSERLVVLRFEEPNYKALELQELYQGQLVVAYLTPVPKAAPHAQNGPTTAIANVVLRYTTKGSNTVNVGSAVNTFEVTNTGNVQCEGQSPCSPDGKWKAALGQFPFDAGENNQFRNPRLSCIAGPCPFTRVEANRITDDGRRMAISVLNWSDTTTFLMEAEVVHTMQNEVVRHAYPAIFGRVMSFTVPEDAEGPSVEAELNGRDIVFPMGPDVVLSWATCTVTRSDHTKLYRCGLKTGYEFH